MNGQAGANKKQKHSLGIPEITRRIQLEKISETVPVKLQPSLASYVRAHGGSTLIREAVLFYLKEN